MIDKERKMIMKEKNVGKVDSYIRFALGFIFVLIAFILQGGWYWLLLPALVFFVTGAIGHCGLYSLIGINTCKAERK